MADTPPESPQFHWESIIGEQLQQIWRCQSKQTTVELWPRPPYCDRGRWQAHVDVPGFPCGYPTNPSPFDSADGFLRYYFDLDRAKAEIEDMFRFRGYVP